MFLHLSVILLTGGACVVAPGGPAWLLRGGMRGCSGGACVVALRGVRGCSGGMHGCSRGGVWLLRGMCGCSQGGCAWLLGGHAWLLLGGVCGCLGVCVVARGGIHGCSGGGMHGCSRDTEIRSMSGRYASYWNAFLFFFIFPYSLPFLCVFLHFLRITKVSH